MEKISQKQNKTLCIIQARLGSTRLPEKVLLKVKGISLLEYELNRVKLAKTIDTIVVATTTNKEDDAIERLCKQIKIDCFRGSENDVLDRYYQCSLLYPDFFSVVRVTGDCPLIDPAVIDKVVNLFKKRRLDYASNIKKETFPDGMDVEVFTKEALREAAQNARLSSEREHVTPYITKNKKFKKGEVRSPKNWGSIRLTVDEKEDFEVVKFLIEKCPKNMGYMRYISLLMKHPEIIAKNMHIARNEGYQKSLKNDTVVL